MTIKEVLKRAIELLTSNECGEMPPIILPSNAFTDGLEELWRRIKEVLGNKRGSLGIPEDKADEIAEILLPDIVAFFQTEEGKRIFAEWKIQQEEKKLLEEKKKNDVA